MADPSQAQAQPEDTGNEQALSTTGSDVPRRVPVKGSGGVTASVTVRAQHGKVWLSIVPPFTWDAIMDPGKVDELIRTLAVARDDAKGMERATRVPRGTT